MKRYEYNLYILEGDNVTSLTFDNILDIPVEDDVMKENLRRIYGTDKINIYQISNEYDIVLKVYIIDEDGFSYEVTDLYQKLASKVVNTMYGIFSKREKEYRSVISKNNSAYLMSKWNILRKNVILKYESLKKSVECANLILSGFENNYMFNDENFRKYYLLEKEKISLLEEKYLKKAGDRKVFKYSEDETDNYIKMSYILKNKNYFKKDLLIKERNEAFIKVILNSEKDFEKAFHRLSRRGIYMRKVNGTVRLYTAVEDSFINDLIRQFNISSVNERILRYISQDEWDYKYFVKYMENEEHYSDKRNEELDMKINLQIKDIKDIILMNNDGEYRKLEKHKLFRTFVEMKNVRDRFYRLNEVLSYIEVNRIGTDYEKKQVSYDKKNISMNPYSYFPVTIKYLDENSYQKEESYQNVTEIENIMYKLSEKYVSDFNRKLKTHENKFAYTRYLYLESYRKKNPSTDSEENNVPKRLLVKDKTSTNTIFFENESYLNERPYISECFCEIDDIMEYLDINFLTSDKVNRFIEFSNVRKNFEYKKHESSNIIELMKGFGQLGVDISNRIKMFKRDYVKNAKVRQRVDVRPHKKDNTYKRIKDIYSHLEFLEIRSRMLSKIKERDIIPMMFRISTLKIPCITVNDVNLEVARYKKYSISSKDSVYVVDRTDESEKGDVKVDTDYLMYLSVLELSGIFRYSGFILHRNDRWNIIREYAFAEKKENFIPALTFVNEIYSLDKFNNMADSKDLKEYNFSNVLKYENVFNVGFDARTFRQISKMNMLPNINLLLNTVNSLSKKVKKYEKDVDFYYINNETAEIMNRESYIKKIWLNGLRDDEKRRLVSLDKQING